MKILSQIPSAKEIITSLNLSNNLVGISNECYHPKEVLKLHKPTTLLEAESRKPISANINDVSIFKSWKLV